MERQSWKTGAWLVAALLWFSCVSAAVAAMPPCGSDPSANTLLLQNAIDQAPAGSTLELPPGVCILAKCDMAQGHICYSPAGLRHSSALHIGKKSKLTLAGAVNGTSVLKLDPHPPGSPGRHAYCSETHVLSMHLSQSITLRDFTIDGSDGELPEDATQCPGSKRINERMFNVYVVNATHITIDRMKLIKAHGDGLYMIAERNQTTMPFTENIAVTNTEFLANDRSGITFQRNVGKVSIVGNYFRNSGGDQDLDMEPSGGPQDRGPYDVVIDNNVFERLRGGITVTLGGGWDARTQHTLHQEHHPRFPIGHPPDRPGRMYFRLYGRENHDCPQHHHRRAELRDHLGPESRRPGGGAESRRKLREHATKRRVSPTSRDWGLSPLCVWTTTHLAVASPPGRLRRRDCRPMPMYDPAVRHIPATSGR